MTRPYISYIKYIMSLVLLVLITGSLTASLTQVAAGGNSTQTSVTLPSTIVPCQVVSAKAKVLYDLLNNTINMNLNISTDLKNKIQMLLKTNISELSCDQLRDWIDQAVKIHSELAGQIRTGLAYAVGQVEERYLNGLKNSIEKRLRKIASEYNLSQQYVNELINNLSKARDIEEINKVIKSLNDRIYAENSKRFVDELLNISSEDVVKDEKGLEVAIQHIDLVYTIVNKTLQRLIETNASEEAINALKKVLDKLYEARALLQNISLMIKTEKPVNYKEFLNKTLEKIREELLDEIYDLKEELLELRQLLVETNQTQMISEIDQLLERLDNISKNIQNMSIEDLRRVLPDLYEIKLRIKYLKEMYEETIEKIKLTTPVFFNEILFNKKLTEVYNTITYINKTLDYIKNVSSQVCNITTTTTQTPTPPISNISICQFIDQQIKMIKNMTSQAQQLADKASSLYKQGNKSEGFLYLLKAEALAKTSKELVDKLKEIIETMFQKIGRKPSEKSEIEIQGYLKYTGGNNAILHLDIENKGKETVEISKIIIIELGVEINRNISITSGQKISLDIKIDLTIQMIQKIRQLDRINLMIIMKEQIIYTTIEVQNNK